MKKNVVGGRCEGNPPCLVPTFGVKPPYVWEVAKGQARPNPNVGKIGGK